VGRDEEAFAEINRSIALEPQLWANYYRLGGWEGDDYGRLDEALIQYRKAYALDPENDRGAWLVASIYADFGAEREALAWIERAMEVGPGSSFSRFVAYYVYLMFGHSDEAMAYAERALELGPRNAYALHAVGTRDIRQGRAEAALERWRLEYPLFATSDRPDVQASDLQRLLFYADNLMEAGESERAEKLLNHGLDVLDKRRSETFVRESAALELEQQIYAALENREETLAAVRTAIVERRNYSGTWMYAFPMFDFLRDDPEFQELMDILRENLARQYARIQEMERNGELPPAPGVNLP